MLQVCRFPGCDTFTLGALCLAHEPAPRARKWPRGRPYPRAKALRRFGSAEPVEQSTSLRVELMIADAD